MADYCSKADVISWIKIQRPDFLESSIDDVMIRFANTYVNSGIIQKGYDVPATDIADLLWAAAFCWILESLCMSGVLEWSTGDIAMRQLGAMTSSYQRWQPMFFFAQGDSKPHRRLLPHETYRMLSQWFIDAWAMAKFSADNDEKWPSIKMGFDLTSRGMGWNLDTDYIEADDEVSESFASGIASNWS